MLVESVINTNAYVTKRYRERARTMSTSRRYQRLHSQPTSTASAKHGSSTKFIVLGAVAALVLTGIALLIVFVAPAPPAVPVPDVYEDLEICLTEVGFGDALLCWNGTDYCEYPVELGGFNGTIANSLAEVQQFIGNPYEVNVDTGCWDARVVVESKKRTTIRPAGLIRTGLPNAYMVLSSESLGGAVSLPFGGYAQTEYAAHRVDIDWGDGTIETDLISAESIQLTHLYDETEANQTYTIRISGTAMSLCYSYSDLPGQLRDVLQWGRVVTYQLNLYDELRLGSLAISATDAPNPSLVDIRNLFAIAGDTLTTAGEHSTRTGSFANWLLPNVALGANAFVGVDLTSASGNLLTSAPLIVAQHMFEYSILPDGLALADVVIESPVYMFHAATFAGSVTFSSVVINTDATSMFRAATFSAAVSFDGLDLSAATVVDSLFHSATIAADTTMATLNFTSATSATHAFHSASRVVALPALSPVSLIDGTCMFCFTAFAEDIGSLSWSFPVLTGAADMFMGTDFDNHTFYTHTWGMNSATTLNNMFYYATNLPNTIDIGPWQMQQLQSMAGVWYGATSYAGVVVANYTLWETPALTTLSGAFASVDVSMVRLVGLQGLDTASVTSLNATFASTPMSADIVINDWNVTGVTVATDTFFGSLGTAVNVAGWRLTSVVDVSQMFRASNVDPDFTSWSMPLLTTAENFLEQCHLSTPELYSQALIMLESTTTATNVTLGGPRSNVQTSYESPTRVLQTYTGEAAQNATDALVARGWTLQDGGASR